MEITYLGHSCFNLDINGVQVLFDPFITANELAKDIDINTLKPDFLILSHGHGDHIADVETIYQNSQPTVISTYEVINYLANKGIEKVHPMNHGGKWKFDFGTIKVVNAVHSSSMPDGSYGGNPAGFVITTSDNTFYYAGDTALTMDMKLISEEFKIDFAFLPIGDNFTMDIGDALKAAELVGTSKIIPMHYDTFPYIKIDHKHVKKLAQQKEKELLLLQIGEKINI